MDSLPDDLLATTLAKMSLKNIVTSKLVCKKWKSILESKFFYQIFQSQHHNSQSLWSLMCLKSQKEVIAHYKCNNWDLTKSLGSYISSFITSLCHTEGLHGHQKESVWVAAYSDVGLMLITFDNSGTWYKTLYVANPISREYVKIPPLIPCINWETGFTISGLVTQVANGIVSSYKIVLVKYIETEKFETDICLLIYSSERGLWSLNMIRSPFCCTTYHPISLNENLYWIGFDYILQKVVLVYYNFYATDKESDRCRVIPLPSVDKRKFRRVCTTSQGSLIYMETISVDKDDGSFEHKLSVWRLKSEEWQLLSQIVNPGLDHIHLTVNPFDAKTVYFWITSQNRLTSINLDKCKLGLHDNFECSSSDGCNQRIPEEWDLKEGLNNSQLRMVVLPRWLYRIPFSPSCAK